MKHEPKADFIARTASFTPMNMKRARKLYRRQFWKTTTVKHGDGSESVISGYPLGSPSFREWIRAQAPFIKLSDERPVGKLAAILGGA